MVSQYKGIPIQKIVDDTKWQELRQSLVGTWKKTPIKNIYKLRKYIVEKGISNREHELRLVRVQNYLSGTGFRTGTIAKSGSVTDSEIKKLKRDVNMRLESFR